MKSNINIPNPKRKLENLVENKTIFSSDISELNLFETYKSATDVNLTFNAPVITCMLQGKKVMHLKNTNEFDFYPGESVVMPANEEMFIDFPLASFIDPTRCVALTIMPSLIKETIHQFNVSTQIESDRGKIWEFDTSSSHLTHTEEIHLLMERLFKTYVSDNINKDILVNIMLKELIVRLMQTKAKKTILSANNDMINNQRIAYIVKYIKDHLTEKISVDELAQKAYMSPSHFHKTFKSTIGETPIDFINKERINMAKHLIERRNLRISDVAFMVGYSNISYFNRIFKKYTNVTPLQYKNLGG